jgi:hypothetical protein
MARRVLAVVAATMIWSMASGATAQTTSTSSTSTSSTSSSSTTSTSTTVTPTTSTTLANFCAGRVCTGRPPPAFLAGVNGEVALEEDSSCWSTPLPNAPGHVVGLCGDELDKVPDPILRIRAGETLTLRFGAAMTPTSIVLHRGTQSTPISAGNPARFVANLPVGVHEVFFSTRWYQGDASYLVRLDVRAAPRPLALTG